MAAAEHRQRHAVRAGPPDRIPYLADIGALKPDVSVSSATDVLWFYFGYYSYFTLTDENGWPLAEAEKWLLAQASSALLT
jgi:hypothetical protein